MTGLSSLVLLRLVMLLIRSFARMVALRMLVLLIAW